MEIRHSERRVVFMPNGLPKMVEITRVEKETGKHSSFYFEHAFPNAKPGQFLMAWIPGVDEKPISFSKISREECGITVEAKGIWSNRMAALKKGDNMGVRGPFGNGFDLIGCRKALVVAGGCGAAPLRPLVDECLQKGVETRMVLGARSSGLLLFKNELGKKLGERLRISTDDGSEGRKGFVTDALKALLKEEKPDCVFCCGPEPMLKAVLDSCESFDVKCQLSLERFMKCGFGVCGQCVFDDLLVCKDGPVFTGGQLRKSREFGSVARLKSGKEVSLKEYAEWRQL